MNFANLCEFFETFRQMRTQQEKTTTARNFFNKLRETPNHCFLVMRLIVPKLDRDRQAYRIKESKISRILMKMLALPQGPDKTLLTKASLAAGGDFGAVIYSVLKKYIVSRKTELSVEQVNEYLNRIANRTTDTGLDDLLLEIFRKLSSIDTKWFIQIILKNLALGIGDNGLLNCYHPDAAAYYSMNSNLKKVCETFLDTTVKLHELEINIFEAFRPMLSKRCDSSNFKKSFPDNKMFYVENKFDGERFQLHMANGEFKYFSRGGFDFTKSFGANFNEGIFTPLLKNAFHSEVNRLILDGEMMLWNKRTKSFGSKGMNLDVKNLGVTGQRYQPCFCVFDALLYNDKILTNQPLKKRMAALKKIIQNPIEGVILISQVMEAKTRQDIVDFLNAGVDKNEEGIVVKDPESIYRYAERNCGWYKIKMDFFDDVVHDLDVLLMGGSYGSNKRITSFFVGIVSGSLFLSLGRISSGLNDEQLELLSTKLKTAGLEFKHFSSKTKGKLVFGRDIPDLYIEPEDSCILVVRASELVRTTSNGVKTPYTMRFPRVLAIREDKPPNECLSMNELLELTRQNKAVIKLNKRHIELDEIVPKTKPKIQKLNSIVKHEHSKTIGRFLENKKFYVLSGSEHWSKDNICNSIIKAGGQLAYKVEPGIDIALASSITDKVKSLIKDNVNFDIISVNWLRTVIDSKKLIPFRQGDIINFGMNFKSDLGDEFDHFGDSFTEPSTVESLKHIFGLMNQKEQHLNMNHRLTFESNKWLDFQNFTAYFDNYEKINDFESKKIYSSVIDEVQFQYYNGCISPIIDEHINLVIISDISRKSAVLQFLQENKLTQDINIVGVDFLYC